MLTKILAKKDKGIYVANQHILIYGAKKHGSGWVCGWVDGWMGGLIDGWVDRWMIESD